jgi:flagellar hook-associated protein 1 FlgK
MSMINIAYSGLQAAQFGMNVTSMNVANIYTEGYSRQGSSRAPSARWARE